MKTKVIIKFITTIFLMFFTFSIPFSATAEESPSENRYYMGEAVKTGLDNGYKGEEKIKEGDVHFNWKLGEFFVDGFTSVVKDEDDSPNAPPFTSAEQFLIVPPFMVKLESR